MSILDRSLKMAQYQTAHWRGLPIEARVWRHAIGHRPASMQDGRVADMLMCQLLALEIEENDRARTAVIPKAIAAGVSYHGEGEGEGETSKSIDECLEGLPADLRDLELVSQEQAERIMEYVRKREQDKLPGTFGRKPRK